MNIPKFIEENKKWLSIGCEENEKILIFFLPHYDENENKRGFHFLSVQAIEFEEGKIIEGEILYNGIAEFGYGISHMYLGEHEYGSHDFGYEYCPCLKNHIDILNCLRELEKKYCGI